jgi:hypothetical protein
MKRFALLLVAGWMSCPSWGQEQCLPHETSVIDEEAHCVDSAGISIADTPDDSGLKVACMRDQKVKSLCGADGQITRLHAYSQWFKKLQQFEDHCAADGGTFGFQDPTFAEPKNESYCLQAVPEVSSNMFEEPLCNYRSLCPAVTVICERTCSEHIVAKLY